MSGLSEADFENYKLIESRRRYREIKNSLNDIHDLSHAIYLQNMITVAGLNELTSGKLLTDGAVQPFIDDINKTIKGMKERNERHLKRIKDDIKELEKLGIGVLQAD